MEQLWSVCEVVGAVVLVLGAAAALYGLVALIRDAIRAPLQASIDNIYAKLDFSGQRMAAVEDDIRIKYEMTYTRGTNMHDRLCVIEKKLKIQ